MHSSQALQVAGRCVFPIFALWSWLFLVFVHPLKDDAMLMHFRQLDPTDIVLIPIPLERLFFTSGAIGFVAILLTPSTSTQYDNQKIISGNFMWQKFLHLIQLTILATLVMILCGASPFENIPHTILASLFLAALVLLDLPGDNVVNDGKQPTNLAFSTAPSHHHSFFWRISPSCSPVESTTRSMPVIRCSDDTTDDQKCSNHYSTSYDPQQYARVRAHCTVGVTVILQILRLYDRGWQVQRWPVPTILGSAIGWTIGVVLSALILLVDISSLKSSRMRSDRKSTEHMK